jgi:hypothetical protein
MMDETGISQDGHHVLLIGQNTNGHIDIFVYDTTNLTKSTPYTTSCGGGIGAPNQNGCLHKLIITADNKPLIQFVNDGSGTENGVRLWNGASLTHVQDSTSHIDAGEDLNGNPVLIELAGSAYTLAGMLNPCTDGFDSLSSIPQGTALTGAGGNCIVDSISAWHVGYQGGPSQPWAAVSMFAQSCPGPESFTSSGGFVAPSSGNWQPYEDEVVIARVDASRDPSKVYRLAHMRTRSCEGAGIQAQGLASISMDGKYVTFTSNMAHLSGCPSGFASGDCEDQYVIGPLF